jgi:hypothetical protein
MYTMTVQALEVEASSPVVSLLEIYSSPVSIDIVFSHYEKLNGLNSPDCWQISPEIVLIGKQIIALYFEKQIFG